MLYNVVVVANAAAGFGLPPATLQRLIEAAQEGAEHLRRHGGQDGQLTEEARAGLEELDARVRQIQLIAV